MTEPPYPDALATQHRLHWYVLEKVLGQGGFGITYLARDTNLDQPVAIKEYLPTDVATRRTDATVRPRTEEHGERYRWGLERFIREARTLARFDHPNIVRVHSVFELNNTAYMVMRFEEGENLAAVLERRRTLPEDELVRVLLPILAGLELVHNAGFIHRDVKPDNIYIRADGSPVLLDFGSARHALGHARTVTILIAPGYAPFEQYYSTGENQGPWTDLYSLGATCYRAIAGVAPIDAIARSKGILGSTRELLVPAQSVGAGRYSNALLKAVDHALAFAEKDRPQTIAEWRSELSAPSHAERAPVAPSRQASASPVQPAPPGPSLRGPVIWAMLGAVVAAVAVVVWLVPGDRGDKLAVALERSESARRELETQRQREALEKQAAEKEARRLREEQAQREALQREIKPKVIEPRPAEPKIARKPEPKARAQPAVEVTPAPAKRAEETVVFAPPPAAAPPPPPVAAPSPPPVAAPPPTAKAPEPSTKAIQPAPDLLALAQQARVRGNLDESAALYRKAADAGDTNAQFALGELYAAGQGVPQSNFQSYFWFGRAVKGGHPDAAGRLKQVAALLQPAEIRQLERLLR